MQERVCPFEQFLLCCGSACVSLSLFSPIVSSLRTDTTITICLFLSLFSLFPLSLSLSRYLPASPRPPPRLLGGGPGIPEGREGSFERTCRRGREGGREDSRGRATGVREFWSVFEGSGIRDPMAPESLMTPMGARCLKTSTCSHTHTHSRVLFMAPVFSPPLVMNISSRRRRPLSFQSESGRGRRL